MVMRVSDLYERDKPREKLLEKGATALKDHELIAALIGRGVPGRDALAVGREVARLLNEEGLEGLRAERLLAVYGMGEAKAAQILAGIELARRHLEPQRPAVRSAEDVWRQLREYAGKKQEYFLALTLDGASRILATRVIHIGTLNQSIVHPREVFADAVADRAAGIIVAHNHPSGQCFPSAEDRRVTRRLAEAGRLLGIELLDHLILTGAGWYSFSEEGEL
jgi:DNA repair protein RadC